MITLVTLASAASGEQSGFVWLAILGSVAILAGILYLLGRWEEKRSGGRKHSITTRAGAGMLELQSLLEPSKRHVLEARQEKRSDDEGSGDDDDTAGRGKP